MPFALPGLFDFSSGVSSAINQNAGRLANEGKVTSNYLDTLNAFNASLNTNDNLELRQGFAQQPEGTSILDRFSNFAQQTTNPFAANQAVTAGSALSPLLGLTALQNPLFGQQQGLPGSFSAQVDAGLQGGQAIAQQNFNQQLPQFLNTQNPGLDFAQMLQMFTNNQQQGQQNNDQAELLRLRQFEATALQNAANQAQQVTSAATTQSSSQPQRLTQPINATNRQGTIDPVPPPVYGGNQTRGPGQ